MSVTQEQLDDFYQIATDRIQQGDVETEDDLFALWRLLHPSPAEMAEIDESIRRGEEDIRAGRGRSAREVAEEIRQKYGFAK